MLGDGKTEYDYANDGEATAIGACSVSFRFSKFFHRSIDEV
jgi:mannose-binding lectin 2